MGRSRAQKNTETDLHAVLEDAYHHYARHSFITDDPILIPHQFSKKEDIEISGFLTATIAWGQRPTIIKNALKLIQVMDGAPFDFVLNHEPRDRNRLKAFVHRTFNAIDAMYFFEALQQLYRNGAGIEGAFGNGENVKDKITGFYNTFFEPEHLPRTRKHVSNPEKGSSAKRLNMYLRWMVRSPKEGIDFGIWKSIRPAQLMIPLDVHTGTVARKLGLLKRNQDDWKAVDELTKVLLQFDAEDPIKYDLALFGLGVNKSL